MHMYLCSYSLMLACIFVTQSLFWKFDLFSRAPYVFYSYLVFLNLMALVKEILGNQVLES